MTKKGEFRMVRSLLLGLSLVLLIGLTGCGTTKISQPAAPYAVTVKKELSADVKVGDKITGNANISVLFGIFSWGESKFAEGVSYGGAPEGGGIFGPGPEAEVKAAAVYDAVSKNKTDVIVTPAYILDIKNYFVFKTIKADVTGYSGTVSSLE